MPLLRGDVAIICERLGWTLKFWGSMPTMPFRDVIGHVRLIDLLSRSVAGGTVPPSLLFAGPAGVGKHLTALSVAQALNCMRGSGFRVQGSTFGVQGSAFGVQGSGGPAQRLLTLKRTMLHATFSPAACGGRSGGLTISIVFPRANSPDCLGPAGNQGGD